MLNLVFSFYLGLNYIFLPHRPNNLNLSMKTKPVTSGEDATAYVQYLYNVYAWFCTHMYIRHINNTCTVASPPSSRVSSSIKSRFYEEIYTVFGTVSFWAYRAILYTHTTGQLRFCSNSCTQKLFLKICKKKCFRQVYTRKSNAILKINIIYLSYKNS